MSISTLQAFQRTHISSPEGPRIRALSLRHGADKMKNVGSTDNRSHCIQAWWSPFGTADDKPQQKLTLKFHSVLCNVR
jgi:hypothetical protein